MDQLNNFLLNTLSALIANLIVGGLLYWFITKLLNLDVINKNHDLVISENKIKTIEYLKMISLEISTLIDQFSQDIVDEEITFRSGFHYDISTYIWDSLNREGELSRLIDIKLYVKILEFYKAVKFAQDKVSDSLKVLYFPVIEFFNDGRTEEIYNQLEKLHKNSVLDFVEKGRELPREIDLFIKTLED
jgi:hypothetical protein